MSFAKLKLIREDGKEIKALYNPERYSVSKSVQFAEIGIPGLDSPVLQFVRGQNEKVTLKLFFDTTEQGTVEDVKDVRDLTIAVYNLLKVNTATHAPPRFRVEWGESKSLFWQGAGDSPLCVMESMSEEFTLFSPSGTPLRAELNVTIREAPTIKQQLQHTPRESSDRTKNRILQRGQRLSDVAWLEYGDPTNWRPIAEASGISNPRIIEVGTSLRIPSLTKGAA